MSQKIGKKGKNHTTKARKKPSRVDVARAQEARRHFYRRPPQAQPSESQKNDAEVV